MYLEYYGLVKEPFHITPDPEFLYLSPSHKKALGVILSDVENRAGLMMITGGVGLGKTTILRAAMQQFDKERIKTVLVFNPCISYSELLKLIYEELGLGFHRGDNQFQAIQRLHLALIEDYQSGNNVILVIDEAQNMPVDTLENLMTLSELETNNHKLIQIALVGQHPELDNLLNRDALRQLKRRIAHRVMLDKLTKKESIDYIGHRLKIASAVRSSPFTESAIDQIVKHCEGVPRCINITCDNALVSGFGSSQNPIRPALVREVIDDLEGRQRGLWKRWVMAPISLLLLLASLFLYLYLSGSDLASKGFRGTSVSSQEKGNVTTPPLKPREAPHKAATSSTMGLTSEQNQVEARSEPPSVTKPGAASTSIVPGQQSASSRGATETLEPSQPSSTAPLDSAKRIGLHPIFSLESKPEPIAQTVPPPEEMPTKLEAMLPATDAGSASLPRGSVPEPGVPSKRALPTQEESTVQTAPVAKAKSETESSKSAGLDANRGAAEEPYAKSAGAGSQALPNMKTDAQTSHVAPSTSAGNNPQEKHDPPDPSDIIDWLIEKRAKGKGSRAK